MMPSPTAPERVRTPTPARPGRSEPRPAHVESVAVHRIGTRSGWAMRIAYLTSDLVAIGLSFAAAELGTDLALGLPLGGLSVLDFKLYVLLGIGLIVVATTLKTYSAIPPRPVRQFRGWVLGAAGVCCHDCCGGVAAGDRLAATLRGAGCGDGFGNSAGLILACGLSHCVGI